MRIYFIALIIFQGFFGYAQSKNSDRTQNNDLMVIYEFGAFFDSGSSCEKKIREKYGFKTTWGTCIATKKMIRNNSRVYRKIKRRHGYNWEERYEKEIKQCQ